MREMRQERHRGRTFRQKLLIFVATYLNLPIFHALMEGRRNYWTGRLAEKIRSDCNITFPPYVVHLITLDEPVLLALTGIKNYEFSIQLAYCAPLEPIV